MLSLQAGRVGVPPLRVGGGQNSMGIAEGIGSLRLKTLVV
jgi:hypothetical protein